MDPAQSHQRNELPQARVFALVFLASVLLQFVGPYGNVSTVGTLDPWVYTGYFLNFNDMVARFGHTYYVSRAPYVYVGVALYSVFSPAVANLVLNALLWTGIAAPLFLITRKYFGSLTALIPLIATFANPYLGWAITWDYPDGPAISFVALGLWLALAPPKRWPATLALALAGACWTMAGITNMISALIVLSSIVTVVIWRIENVKRSCMDLLAIGAGATVCLGVWCVASRFVIGQWNVLGPQLAQIAYAKANPSYLQNMWGRGYEWLHGAYRLLALPVVLIANVVLVNRWRTLSPLERRALIGSIAGMVLAGGLFAWYEFGDPKVLLRVAYCSSYLALTTMLSVAVVAGIALRQSGRWAIAEVALILVCGLTPIVWRAYGHHALDSLSWSIGFGVAVAALGGLAWRTSAAFGIGACCFAVSYSLDRDPSVSGFAFRPKEAVLLSDSTNKIVSGEAAYQLEIAADLIVFIKNARDKSLPLKFWYDRDEPHVNLFHSLYSLYLWGYRDLTAEFSLKTNNEMRGFLSSRSLILHLTEYPAKIEARHRLLESRGIGWREIGVWNLGRRGQCYRVAIDEVTFPQSDSK